MCGCGVRAGESAARREAVGVAAAGRERDRAGVPWVVTYERLAARGAVLDGVRAREEIAAYPDRSVVPRRDGEGRGRPSRQVMSTVRSPRARSPRTEPSGQAAAGRAGRRAPPRWLCSSISAIPAVAPKLPSIWNGGWVSHRLGRVDSVSCPASSRGRGRRRSSRAQKLTFHARLQPVPPSPRASRETAGGLGRRGRPGAICRPGCRAKRWETCRWVSAGSSRSAFHSWSWPQEPMRSPGSRRVQGVPQPGLEGGVVAEDAAPPPGCW